MPRRPVSTKRLFVRSSPAAALRADVEVDAVLLIRGASFVVAAVEARAPDEAVFEREDPGAVPVSHAAPRPWIPEAAADQHRVFVERPRRRRADGVRAVLELLEHVHELVGADDAVA